jgi:hypothetical protein
MGHPRDDGPPDDWPDYGTYVPGGEEDRPWGGPSLSAPRRPHTHSRRHRIPGRLLTAAALLAIVAAVSVLVFPRNGLIRLSTASNPGAGSNQHVLNVRTGAGHVGSGGPRSPAASPPAISQAEAEKVLGHYWQVNNEANELRSDAWLGTSAHTNGTG